nr:hypothetical protein [uncultured Albidiferax sp.]
MPSTDTQRWWFWIDRGGVFTDVVGPRPADVFEIHTPGGGGYG